MIRQTTGWVTRDATVDEGVRPPEAGAQVQILREHHVWPANITASRLLFALIYWGGIHPLLSIAGVTARAASRSSSPGNTPTKRKSRTKAAALFDPLGAYVTSNVAIADMCAASIELLRGSVTQLLGDLVAKGAPPVVREVADEARADGPPPRGR